MDKYNLSGKVASVTEASQLDGRSAMALDMLL
jgi:hypothetical protein